MSGGLTLSYRKTLDVLTVAYTRHFLANYPRGRAEGLAREVAEELLRAALSPTAVQQLDRQEAARRRENEKRRKATQPKWE